MSDPSRYRSSAILREETLYYDLGYRFSDTEGKKTEKAFANDYSTILMGVTLGIQILLGIPQLFTILMTFILLGLKYSRSSKADSPIILIVILVAHVYDYQIAEVIAKPGQIIQGNLTFGFWFLETVWLLVLTYQVLIIFQPYTPTITKGQSVVPQTSEAIESYNKMTLRLMGSDFSVDPLNKLINIEKLQKILIDLIKLSFIIMGGGIIMDILFWRIIFNLGGGTNIEEQYVITGMSLVLFVLLIGFSNLIVPDPIDKESETLEEKPLPYTNNEY